MSRVIWTAMEDALDEMGVSKEKQMLRFGLLYRCPNCDPVVQLGFRVSHFTAPKAKRLLEEGVLCIKCAASMVLVDIDDTENRVGHAND